MSAEVPNADFKEFANSPLETGPAPLVSRLKCQMDRQEAALRRSLINCPRGTPFFRHFSTTDRASIANHALALINMRQFGKTTSNPL